MRVVLATSNRGKLREFEALGRVAGWSFELPVAYDAPAEDGLTYAENAEIKAETLWKRLAPHGPRAVMADDSGLEIVALDGRPGVHSARYLGESASWSERRRGLLHELAIADGSDRRAAFHCALHLIDRIGRSSWVEARYDGTIAIEERGAAGFSYDPIFLDPETDLTFGELSETQKNAKSHRGRAFAALLTRLAAAPASTGHARHNRDDRI